MDDPQEVKSVLEGASSLAPVLFGLAMVVGLAVWLLGRKLARPMCAVSGVVLGGLGGLMLGEMLQEQGAFVIPLVIGAGIGGGLLATLLFRVWMGLSGAVLLALVVPAAVLIWQGTPLDAAATQPAEDTEQTDDQAESQAEKQREQARQQREAADADAPSGEDADSEDTGPTAKDLIPAEARRQLSEKIGEAREVARTWYDQQKDRLGAWWDGLGGSGRMVLYVAAAVGAFVGLTLGLTVPYTAAAVQSALVGAILLLLPARELAHHYAGPVADWLPHTPRQTLVALGLITGLGVLVQWTLFHKQADK